MLLLIRFMVCGGGAETEITVSAGMSRFVQYHDLQWVDRGRNQVERPLHERGGLIRFMFGMGGQRVQPYAQPFGQQTLLPATCACSPL